MADTADSTMKDAGHDKLVQAYTREIERYNSVARDWMDEGENIVKTYLSEIDTSGRRYALLWANVETLKPNVYAKPPTVLCSRRYKDRDPIARTAAEIMERATNTTFELYGVDETFRMVRDDRLLPGRGQAWVRYEAQIDRFEETTTVIDKTTGAEVEQETVREVLRGENACVDYVHWQDFGHNVARTWKDVWLVWRITYKTQDEVAEVFGGEKAARVAYNAKPPTDSGRPAGTDSECFAKILELWDKRRGLTSWLVDGEKSFLDSGPPPVNLSSFFPCPEPCYATKTSKGLIPRPDYLYYRDQAKEINDLTVKIHNLMQWLIVKAFIPSGPSSVADPLEDAIRDKDNSELFVQVDSMKEWSERGGASKLIDWLPLGMIIEAIQAAINARNQLLQDVFQLTGVADILRGQTDPDETYGAVELRAQTGTRRLRNTKDEIARFCRDISRLTAEVIAENFTPRGLAEITGFKYLPPAPVLPPMLGHNGGPVMSLAGLPGTLPPVMGGAAPAMVAPQRPGMAAGPLPVDPELTFDDRVVEFLRNDRMRSFRIEVETDSTVQADENSERSSRIAFTEAAGSYLERAARVVAQAPALAETAGAIMMFALRSFRPGRTMEELVERGFENLVKQSQAVAQQPKPEDPVITVAKTQVAGEIEKNRINAQLKAQEQRTDAMLEIRDQDIDAAVKIRQQDIDANAKARDAATEMVHRIADRGLEMRQPPVTLPVVNGGAQ